MLLLVFQNGNGESLLGFTSHGGVANRLPLFLFVVLFGPAAVLIDATIIRARCYARP